MTDQRAIKDFARRSMVEPCRTAGVHGFSIRAGDLQRVMGSETRLSEIRDVLGSREFRDACGVQLVGIERPESAHDMVFHFRFERGHVEGRQSAESASRATPVDEKSSPSAEASGRVERVFLVACVSGKQQHSAPARELYVSDWFRKVRTYVEATGAVWYILSAEYGLVHPDTVIKPYERTLNTMKAQEHQAWARRVREQIEASLPEAGEIVLLAGERYRELLMEALQRKADRVSVPMEGLRIGEQLRWLGEACDETGATGRASAVASDRSPAIAPELAERLLVLGRRIDPAEYFPTVEPEAAPFALFDPYAFLMAICLERGTKADIIWTIPYWLHGIWGHLDPARIHAMSENEVREAIDRLPRKPRYLSDAPKTIAALTRIVVEEHDGNARALWRGRAAAEFRATLERIRGVGPGIASMAVQLVELAFPGELAAGGNESRDIKADVHTKRVLHRLGVASDESEAAALAASRGLRPEHPGELDGPLWYIGRTWCHPVEPDCPNCFLTDLCAKRGVASRKPATAGLVDPSPPAPRKRGCPGGKYAPLQHYLAQRAGALDQLSLSFQEIEEILGFSLPASARRYQAWWSGRTVRASHSHAQAWLNAGFRVRSVNLSVERADFVLVP